MKRRAWLIALPISVAVGVAGGSAWWLAQGTDSTVAPAPMTEADRDDVAFASDDLVAFLLPESDYEDFSSDPFTLGDATIEFHGGFMSDAASGCHLPHNGITTAPAGYRLVQGSYDTGGVPQVTQQQVFLFSSVDEAQEAFASVEDLLDDCISFSIAQPDGGRGSDVTIDLVSLNGDGSAAAGIAEMSGYEIGNVGWVVMRQANVITTMSVLELLDDDLVSADLMRGLAALMQDRADYVSQLQQTGVDR